MTAVVTGTGGHVLFQLPPGANCNEYLSFATSFDYSTQTCKRAPPHVEGTINVGKITLFIGKLNKFKTIVVRESTAYPIVMDASSVQNDVDTGLDRVKELEAMVKKLTHENQKLLTKVQEPLAVEKPPTSAISERVSSRDHEDDLIPFSGSEGEDDEW